MNKSQPPPALKAHASAGTAAPPPPVAPGPRGMPEGGTTLDVDLVKPRLDELLTQSRHSELRGEFRSLNEVDIAEYLTSLSRELLLVAFRTLPKDKASDVFAYMDSDQREALIDSIGDAELSALVDEMFVDDAVDFLEELPADLVKRILQFIDRSRREIGRAHV